MASEYSGLLLDYGGVLTSNPFDSFGDFCAREGLARAELEGLLGVELRLRASP